ncbi:MAG: META domain-containing protein [Sphingomonadaceae bacterium]|nr:META domain-containing protein [Sphingomonadaceae bacterium]
MNRFFCLALALFLLSGCAIKSTSSGFTLRGESYARGCGGNTPKPDQLDRTQWRVVSLDGSVLPPTQLIEVRFTSGPMIAVTGCSRYSIDYKIDLAKLRFRPAQRKTLYCEVTEEISDQQFIDMTSGETQFEIMSDGHLSVVNWIGRQLLLRQTR